MDYSELVYAIQRGDERKANRMCAKAMPILKKYLIANLDASPEDAEDAVSKMFEYVIRKIQNDEIESPTGLLSYMLSGARHSYLKIVRDYKFNEQSELDENWAQEPDQIWNLVNDERKSILARCIEQLKGHYRDLIQFLISYPDAGGSEVSEQFGISESNAWIRKHRLLEQMRECVKRYL
ncbi:MAG: hypothetical protein GVY02_07075 [Bacteroidetes bacterium]|jgi:DNA-directed RNA polymerase specialized sigma24 family protein|nr:hypothetical protein [Bacteroidota bacterium]